MPSSSAAYNAAAIRWLYDPNGGGQTPETLPPTAFKVWAVGSENNIRVFATQDQARTWADAPDGGGRTPGTPPPPVQQVGIGKRLYHLATPDTHARVSGEERAAFIESGSRLTITSGNSIDPKHKSFARTHSDHAAAIRWLYHPDGGRQTPGTIPSARLKVWAVGSGDNIRVFATRDQARTWADAPGGGGQTPGTPLPADTVREVAIGQRLNHLASTDSHRLSGVEETAIKDSGSGLTITDGKKIDPKHRYDEATRWDRVLQNSGAAGWNAGWNAGWDNNYVRSLSPDPGSTASRRSSTPESEYTNRMKRAADAQAAAPKKKR